jgi:hypothetical protein
MASGIVFEKMLTHVWATSLDIGRIGAEHFVNNFDEILKTLAPNALPLVDCHDI